MGMIPHTSGQQCKALACTCSTCTIAVLLGGCQTCFTQKSLFWDLRTACFIITVQVVGHWNVKSVHLLQCTLQKKNHSRHFTLCKGKEKNYKKQKPSRIPRESEQKNMFSNLKRSGVFSSSWTSSAVWCQQNWAEACGLWARCCRGVTTPRWLWMGCAGQTTVQTCWFFGPRIKTLPQRETSVPLPSAMVYILQHFASQMEMDHN